VQNTNTHLFIQKIQLETGKSNNRFEFFISGYLYMDSLNIVGYLYTCVHVFLTFDPKFDLRFRLPDPENIRFNHLLTINGQS